MSRSLTPSLADVPDFARSARHSARSGLARGEAGAAPQSPCGVAPPLTVDDPDESARPGPAVASVSVSPVGKATLTVFEGQAVFRVTGSDRPQMPVGSLFRFRRGSRRHQPLGAVS
jgi:hypothetical protein